jgi:hypothetical protein
MWVRVVPSGTRCEYIPVRSTAPSLPLTVPERTTHTHTNAAESPRIIKKLLKQSISICLREPFRRSRASGNPVKDRVLLDSRLRGNDRGSVPSEIAARQRAAVGRALARIFRGVAPERPILSSSVNHLGPYSRLDASVRTVLAVLVLSWRSLALGRQVCSSRKPQLRLRFPLQNGAGSPCGLRDHSRPPRNIRSGQYRG